MYDYNTFSVEKQKFGGSLQMQQVMIWGYSSLSLKALFAPFLAPPQYFPHQLVECSPR